MFALTRPQSGRIITGVAFGLAERYHLPVTLVRILFAAFVIASPFVLLVYLLLSFSIPDEENVASLLREWPPETSMSARERFEHFAKVLLYRLAPKSVRGGKTTWIAISLLFYAAILELPRAEGTSFYWAHPILTTISSFVSGLAPLILYLSAAAIFFVGWRAHGSSIVFFSSRRDRFLPEHGPAKMVGGVAAGISRVLGIDAAYIRVVLILLNILTLGLVGVLYLLIWYFMRSKVRTGEEADDWQAFNSADDPRGVESNSGFRIVIGLLILLFGVISLATEDRWFFFNQEFFKGIVMAAIGIALVWRCVSQEFRGSSLTLVVGALIFLAGVYSLASALGNLQIGLVDQFEIIEGIGALAFVYFALVSIGAQVRNLALLCALVLAASAAMVALHFTPPAYIAAIVRFYDFFYPIIFAALGLWVSFER